MVRSSLADGMCGQSHDPSTQRSECVTNGDAVGRRTRRRFANRNRRVAMTATCVAGMSLCVLATRPCSATVMAPTRPRDLAKAHFVVSPDAAQCWLLTYASGRRVLGSGIASRQRKRWCDRDGSGDPPGGMRPWRHGCGRPLRRSRQPMPTITGQDSANVWGRCLLRGGTQDNMCPCSRSSTRHHIWPSLSLRLQLGCKRAMHSGLISYKFRTFLVLMALRYPVDSVQFGHGAT